MSELEDKKLFIFDWDGTLSTSTLIVAVSRLLRKNYNIKNIEKNEDYYKGMKNKTLKLELKDDTDKFFSSFYDLYAYFYKPKLKRSSIELLKLLNKKNKTVTLFSDSNSYRLMNELRNLKMTEYFDFILSASSINAYKPDPRGILYIIDKYKIKKENVVYIGDTISDIMAAKFANIDSCIVGDGLEPYNRVKKLNPTFLYKNLESFYKDLL
ncbi:MAG: HAD family hydrolase [Candidatus Micrarchaeia archaeon]